MHTFVPLSLNENSRDQDRARFFIGRGTNARRYRIVRHRQIINFSPGEKKEEPRGEAKVERTGMDGIS